MSKISSSLVQRSVVLVVAVLNLFSGIQGAAAEGSATEFMKFSGLEWGLLLGLSILI